VPWVRIGGLFAVGAATVAIAATIVTATPPAPAGATTATASRPRVVSLHAGYERALAHVTVGPIAGVVPPRGVRDAAVATALSKPGCTEPDCDVSYQEGVVQHKPRVYVLFWGPKWLSDSTAEGVASYLTSFYKGLGQPQDTWSLTTAQYGDPSGRPSFGTSVLRGTYVDSTPPPDPLTLAKLTAEATAVAKHFKIADTLDAQVVIAAQSGTCFGPDFGQQFTGNCGKVPASPPASDYCGWHSSFPLGNSYLTLVNLPYQLDAGTFCGENFVNAGPAGIYDGFSAVGGHEYAESITDPIVNTGWLDPRDTVSGGEIADKCAWGGGPFGLTDPAGDIRLSTGTFAMQSLWSNVVHRCVMTGTLPFTVTALADQASVIGKAVSIAVRAATTPAAPLRYTASGLPDGLSISKKTGTISGTPDVTAGTFTTTVTVAYYAGSTAFSLTWQVSSPPGQVTGYGAKCVADSGGVVKNGSPVDITACTGKAPQQVTFAADGELRLLGQCVTGGKTAITEPCADTANQVWTRLRDGEYVLKLNGTCLTDPASSKKDGTRLTLAACADTANQHWSLPS